MITLKEIREVIADKDTRERFKGYINNLPSTEREKKIVFYRFGLEDGILHTLEETGKVFGVTRERIRQIEAKMLQRMHEKDLSTTPLA